MSQSNATLADDLRLRAARTRADFEARGVNVSEWARDRGFDSSLVMHVLAGTRACKRGQSHRIAVALGIKEEPAPAFAGVALEGFVS